MSAAEALFSLANLGAVVGWLLLLATPTNARSLRVAGTYIPVALASVYVGLIALHWGESQGGFSSLSSVGELFSNQWLLLAGWVHYLAFDFFVGTWETRDAAARGVPRWLVAPCLVLTFLFGPLGLLCYHLARTRSASK